MLRNEKELRSIFAAPEGLSIQKARSTLDRHSRHFISLSPFLVIATSNANGKADVSPRGDPPGFVHVVDDRTFLIPDRPGNNRLDSMVNITENPNVACLFFIPGFEDTLRVAGRAVVTSDASLLKHCLADGKQPKAGILVTVDEVFLHCAKALKRSKLWLDDYKRDRSQMPGLTRIIMEQISEAAT